MCCRKWLVGRQRRLLELWPRVFLWDGFFCGRAVSAVHGREVTVEKDGQDQVIQVQRRLAAPLNGR